MSETVKTVGKRLTPAQKRLLAELSVGGELINDRYSPAIRLIELGYAEKTQSAFGTMRVYITEAGRAALSLANKDT